MAVILIDGYAKILHFGVQLENVGTYNKIYEVKFILNVFLFCIFFFLVLPREKITNYSSPYRPKSLKFEIFPKLADCIFLITF